MTDPRDLSRRDFLAASAVSLIGLALRSEQIDGDLLYVGTYTEGTRSGGIYLLRMDRRSGNLRRIGSVDAGPNPSFLAIHPNRRVLYAVNEIEQGAVSAFAIAKDSGALTRLNEQPSQGGAPCYVSVDRSGSVVLVANYGAGSIALLPVGRMAPSTQPRRRFSTPEKGRMPSVKPRLMPTASLPIPPIASCSPQTWAPTACSSTVSTWTANRCAT